MKLTPIKIETLLHIYSIAEPLRETLAVTAALEEFKRESLIRPEQTGTFETGCGYELLPRGEKLVQTLLATPLPEVSTTGTVLHT